MTNMTYTRTAERTKSRHVYAHVAGSPSQPNGVIGWYRTRQAAIDAVYSHSRGYSYWRRETLPEESFAVMDAAGQIW